MRASVQIVAEVLHQSSRMHGCLLHPVLGMPWALHAPDSYYRSTHDEAQGTNYSCLVPRSVVHSVTHRAGIGSFFAFLFLQLGDQHIGRQRQAATLAAFCRAVRADLGRIDDAELEHVAIFAGGGVVAVGGVLVFQDLQRR